MCNQNQFLRRQVFQNSVGYLNIDYPYLKSSSTFKLFSSSSKAKINYRRGSTFSNISA